MKASQRNLKRLSQDELVSLCLELVKENAQLKDQLKKAGVKPKTKYDPEWSWMQKITFALQSLGKPVLSSRIMQELQKHDDYFDHYNNAAKSFSTFITRACVYHVIVKVRIGGFNGYHYALPEWCDDQGRLLKKYRDKISLI